MTSTSTITLTITCTDAERAMLIQRFIDTANAVTGEVEDDGVPSDPNGSNVDTTGVVWDARYHGVNKTKNQDGTWRRKKNLTTQEKDDADAYEAGCRGAPAAVATAAVGTAPVAAAPTPAPVAAAPAPAAEVPAFLQTGAFTPAMPAVGMPGIPAAAPPAPVVVPVTYPELIQVFTDTIARVGQPVVDANLARIYGEAGVTDMKQLEADENVRRSIKTALEALQPAAA